MTENVQAFAAASIAVGSKSFAAAARLFDRPTREGAIMLYAWCRHCDDVVDGQEAGSAATGEAASGERLAQLRRDTHRAAVGDVRGLHPSFAALAEVVRRHAIPVALLDQHLDGFALDVEGQRYRTLSDLLTYCWHVAGVVGVMMGIIMGVRDEEVLDRAADLGLAFQLTNIARDVVDDARAGRVYLPLDWLVEERLEPQDLTDPMSADPVARLRSRLVAAAEPYYASARIGIDALPRRSAWAIATAEGVYRRIGTKLVERGTRAHDLRVSTTKAEKFALIAQAGWVATRFRAYGAPPRDPALWPRPRV